MPRFRVTLFGCVVAVALAIPGIPISYFFLAKLAHWFEPNSSSLRRELQAADLALANFGSSPAQVVAFSSDYPKSWDTNFFASMAPDGRHYFVHARFTTTAESSSPLGLYDSNGKPVIPLPAGFAKRELGHPYRSVVSRDLKRIILIGQDGRLGVFSLVPGKIDKIDITDWKLLTSEELTWDPSGSRIAYESLGEIFVYDLAAKTTKKVAPGHAPAWSPKGDWIVFRSRSGKAMLVGPEGGKTLTLLNRDRVLDGFVWSPNGDYLTFNRYFQLTFPFDSPSYMGVLRLSDGARCIVYRHSFKGPTPATYFGWLADYWKWSNPRSEI